MPSSSERERAQKPPSTKIPRRKLPRRRIVRRDDYIAAICRGKRVLHVGCTDAPLTEAKYNNGTLLHQKLEKEAAELVGIDIDAASIARLQEKGVRNLHVADAAKIDEFLNKTGFSPEVIVAGEVLEHLENPADFLRGIMKGMSGETELIISVPNAFWSEGFIHILTGKEKVHPEHVAYYSYYTISQLLERVGLAAKEIIPYRNPAPTLGKKITDALQRPLQWISPHFAAGYVISAQKARRPTNFTMHNS